LPHPALISGTRNGLALEGANLIYNQLTQFFLQKITLFDFSDDVTQNEKTRTMAGLEILLLVDTALQSIPKFNHFLRHLAT
jgi:hypothetical protein